MMMLRATFLLLTLTCACTGNVQDGRAAGSFDVPAGVKVLRMQIQKGSIAVSPSPDGRVHYEAATRKGTERAEDLHELAGIAAELRVTAGAGPEVLLLTGPEVPTALAERDAAAVVAMRIAIQVPADLALDLRTERGSLGVVDRATSVALHTGSGDIQLERMTGAAKTFTGAGNHLIFAHSGSLEGRSEHGSFVVHVDRLPLDGRLELHAESGNVQVRLPEGLPGFDLDLATRFGELETALPIERVASGRNGYSAQAKIRAGGPFVKLSAGIGNISLREADADESVPGRAALPR